ncbi:ARM repeat-containing protein [Backusella circina FSU 941]|nr:ARM repeat-containing protein [Backusella circina FSU 941]
MTLDEYDPDDVLLELNRKLSNVSIHKIPTQGGHIDKEALSTIKYLLFSTEYEQIRKSTRLLRRYLTQGHSDEQSINDLLELDILARIKELLQTADSNSIKFECAWIVTNIAAGTSDQTKAIVDNGFIDILLSLINNPKSKLEVVSQAAWALGNVAGESAVLREELMRKHFTSSTVQVLMGIFDRMYNESASGKLYFSDDHSDTYSNVEALIWALSNMSRGGFRTADYYQYYLPIFHIFSKFILFNYPKLQTEVCWGLSRILYNMHEVNYFHNHNVISEELCSKLCDLLSTGNDKLVIPSIRVVVNITSGPNKSVLTLLKSPILYAITRILHRDTPTDIRKDAYLVLSNMAACNDEIISMLIENKSVMSCVVHHITVPGHAFDEETKVWVPRNTLEYPVEDEWRVTRETLWIAFNLISIGSDDSLWELLKQQPTLPAQLVQLLHYPDLPRDTCSKTVESVISLVQQTNKWMGVRYPDGKNPVVNSILSDGIKLSSLKCISGCPELLSDCQKLHNLLEASNLDVNQTNVISSQEANAFGLPSHLEIKSKSNKRRVIRGLEDGDVRLLESAVGNLCI